MNCPLGVIITLLGFLSLPLAGQAYDFQACPDCHGAALYEDNSRLFLHAPYAQQQCAACHASEKADSSQVEAATNDPSASALQDQRKINWLGHDALAATDHGFLLPSDKVGETLAVDVQGADGKLSRREITVPFLADLAAVEDPGKPPTISMVRVLHVERGVFLSATIAWQTDTLTDSLVYYGNRNLLQRSESSNRYGRRHEIVLYNLKPHKTYRFAVVSTDLFGRSQVSDSQEFSTSDPYLAPFPDTSPAFAKSGDTVGMTSSFQRSGSDYLLELVLEQPAAVYVGSKGGVRQQRQVAKTTAVSEVEVADLSHLGLSNEAIISMEACRNCHRNQDTATHPVNVYPKPGMIIPPEYPTLPDGRITCSSCHGPHGSDYAFLSRKSEKRELCVGCHKDML